MAVTVDDLFHAEGDDAVALSVHVQPGAGRTAVVGRHGTALKVRVAAPPEGGRANEACRALLAETFGVAPAEVELVGGESSRAKRFRISAVDVVDFRRLLERALEGGKHPGGPDVRPGGR
jgi:uncharacterized protein (TIGR00251 family)